MTFRANSIRIVAMDSIYFAALMGLFATAMTAVAQGAEPRSEQVADILNDRRLTDDHIDSQLNTDDNMPAGNPAETAASNREAMMFGMKLIERSEGDIRIADVAATSPAWNAGIRRGDRLLSIATLTPQALTPWVEDVGRVLKETPDGQSIPAEIMRGDEKLSLRIRLAESRAAEVRDARKEERALANMAAGNQSEGQQGELGGQGMSGGAVSSADNDDFGNSGAGGWGIGGFFGDSSGQPSDDRMANSAVAQLMAVNTLSGNTANQNQFGQSAGALSASGQVGIAAFQNNGQGVNAIVVVRGLPQGIYRVGLGQGGALTGGFGVNENGQFSNSAQDRIGRQPLGGSQIQNGQFQDQQSTTGPQRPGVEVPGANKQETPFTPQRPGVQRPAPGNPGTPFTPQRPSPGGPPAPNGAAPTGSVAPLGDAAGNGASLADPRSAVLAQQLDPQLTQGIGDATQGPTQVPRTNDPVIPRTSNSVVPRTNNPVVPRQDNAQQNQQSADQFDNDFNSADSGLNNGVGSDLGNTGSMPSVAEIGILRVGPDGSGRVENQLEGLAVRNLAGMSVTVTTEMSQGGNGVAGNQNLDPRTNSGQRGAGVPQNNRAAQRGQNMPGQDMARQGIVATGVIRLIENERLPNLDEGPRALGPGVEPPVDEATRQQQRRSVISDPTEDFDGSN